MKSNKGLFDGLIEKIESSNTSDFIFIVNETEAKIVEEFFPKDKRMILPQHFVDKNGEETVFSIEVINRVEE